MSLAYTLSVSRRRDKKYDALLSNGRVVSFGGMKRDATPYEQYRDSTGLGAYSEYNHNDEKRKELYFKRHGPIDDSNPYSADRFSKMYL